MNSKFAKTAYISLGEQPKAPLTQDDGAGDACLSDCLERTVVGVLSAISSLSIIVICIHVITGLLQGSGESLGWTCT